MKAYKLTNKHGNTYGNTHWEVGIRHNAHGKGKLCTDSWIHFYDDPELTVIFNPIHANYTTPILWEVDAEEPWKNDDGTKFGSTSITVIRRLPLPKLKTITKIYFGILCAKKVSLDSLWNTWADAFLTGKASATTNATYAAIAAYAA